jgi:predicted MFS family arabinose efflux permease
MMFLRRYWRRVRRLYDEYPPRFWALVLLTFIDAIGGALLFPFFSLYVTYRFGVGMTEVGKLFAVFAVTGVLGTVLGGALADSRPWSRPLSCEMTAFGMGRRGAVGAACGRRQWIATLDQAGYNG